MKLNRVQAFGGPDTTALLFGVGYQLDAPEGRGPRARAASRTTNVTGNEVTVMVGTTILNSPDSESNVAESIEYRRGLWRYVDFTASYLHEGGHVQSRRDGIAMQLWATRAFFDDRLTLGVGAGPYLSVTQNDDLPQNRTGDGRFFGSRISVGQLSAIAPLAGPCHVESHGHPVQPRCRHHRGRFRRALLEDRKCISHRTGYEGRWIPSDL